MKATRPLHIAYVFLDFGEGGAQRLALTWFRLLDRARVRPSLICLRGPGALVDSAVDTGVPVHLLGRLRRRYDAKAIPSLARILARGRYDAVHVATYSRAAPYALAAARLARVPLAIAHEHSRPGPLRTHRRLADVALRPGTHYIAASRSLAADLRASGVSDSQIEVVFNGVEEAWFHPPDRHSARHGAGVPSGRPVALVPARLAPRKGHIDFVAAWPSVTSGVRDPLALFAGDGPLMQPLAALVESSGLSGSIRLLGHRQDLPVLLSAADVVVLPSRLEGLPLSILEAMAAGKPVVASDVGGVTEAVQDGVTGFVVPPRDPLRLAHALTTILCAPTLAWQMGEAGRAVARSNFHADVMVRRLEDIYERWLGSRTDPVVAMSPAARESD